MTDKHTKLHLECGQFEKEFAELLKMAEFSIESDVEDLASSIAYVRMKAIEMIEHFSQLQKALEGNDLLFTRDLLMDIQTDMDFLSEEIAEVRGPMIRLINHLEEQNT